MCWSWKRIFLFGRVCRSWNAYTVTYCFLLRNYQFEQVCLLGRGTSFLVLVGSATFLEELATALASSSTLLLEWLAARWSSLSVGRVWWWCASSRRALPGPTHLCPMAFPPTAVACLPVSRALSLWMALPTFATWPSFLKRLSHSIGLDEGVLVTRYRHWVSLFMLLIFMAGPLMGLGYFNQICQKWNLSSSAFALWTNFLTSKCTVAW